MAYNTRFTCNFADLYGMDYRLEIKEDGYNGLSSDILLGAGGFRLTYSGNNRGVGSLIMGSKVDFELQVTNASEKEFIKDLALAGDRDFICTISRDEGSGLYQFWTGFVMSDLVTFQDAPFPFSFNVVASDGFGLAKEIDYTNSVWDAANKPSDVYRTHAQLLVECFNLIGLSDELTASYPFMIGDTLVKETNQVDLSNQSKLDVTRLNTKAFALYDTSSEDVAYTYRSVYDVLDEICKTWNARLIQYDGKFWFIPVANYLDTSANFFAMNVSAIFDSTPLSVDLFQSADKYRRLVGGNFDFYPPLAESCVEYNYFFDPLLKDDVEGTTCGIDNTQTIYKLFDGFSLPNFETYADASVTIDIDYEYKTKYNTDDETNFPEPIPNAVILRLDIRNGDYKLINTIDSIDNSANVTLSSSEWKRNYEHTFSGLSTGQSVLDISIMDCFGMPDSEIYIDLIVDGEDISNNRYVYDATAQTITFSDVGGSVSIFADSTVTVIFDYINNGNFRVHVEDLDTDSVSLVSSTTPLSIAIPKAPEEGGITIDPEGTNWSVMKLYNTPTNAANYGDTLPIKATEFIEDGITPTSSQWVELKKFVIKSFNAEANYSAQPKGSSNTVKECLENDNDSSQKSTIQMITGDRSEVGSDSNIEIQKTNGDWVKSSEWTLSASGLSFTGRLSNCINITNLHTQETPSLRYNGSVTRVGADLFDVVKGIRIPTFNETDDNLFFGGGSFVASEAIWSIQMIQLGINN